MNQSNSIDMLNGQPQHEGEPVFDAPWQARAFAMTLQLHSRGCFTWQEWADQLSANIKRFEQEKVVKDSDDYYRLWLQTLEEMAQK